MSDFPEIEPILDAWLTEDVDTWPDRSVAAVLSTIDHTTQRRARRVPWRTSDMTGIPRYVALLGAALIAAFFIGTAAFVGGRLGETTPTKPTLAPQPSIQAPSVSPPSPSPVAAHSAAPSSSPTPLGAAIVSLDGSLRTSLGTPQGAWAPALSRDGSRVAYVANGSLWVAPVDGGSGALDTGAKAIGGIPSFGPFAIDAAPAWSPDGTQIAYSSGGDIYVVGADGGSTARQLTTAASVDEWPTWSRDGTTIYYVNAGATPLDDSALSPTQEVWKVGAGGGNPKRVTRDDTADLAPDVAANGTLTIWQGGGMVTLDPANGRTRSFKKPSDGSAVSVPEGWNPRLSPDGSKLAYLVWQGSARTGAAGTGAGVPSGLPLMEVDVQDLESGQTTVVGPRVAAIWNPVSWTPDGAALLINRYDDGP